MVEENIEILLAEDNEDDILITQRAFKRAKLLNGIHVVRDGEEAINYLMRQGSYKDAKRPGLVLLDINMPKQNGWEVLHTIKTDPTLASIPVIMLTTSQQDEDVVRSYASGACSFISKPVGFEDFQKLVDRFELYWVLVARLPHTG
ncbi:MAG: response regulator [Nitrospirota bacterium]